MNNIEKLEPYGSNNPDPRFIIPNVHIEFAKAIKQKHVVMNFKNNKDIILKGISFNCVDNALGQNLLNNKSKKFDLGCTIKKDIYQAKNQPQLVIYDAIVKN